MCLRALIVNKKRLAMRILAVVTLTLLPAIANAQAEKAKLAWNLPWDADWVTAVSFVGPNRVAAGNNLGDILVWELPGESGGPAPKPVRRLVGHSNTINRLLTTPDGRVLISASNDHTIRYWDLDAPAKGDEVVALNLRAREEAIKRKSAKVPPPIETKVAIQDANRVLDGHREWVLGLSINRDGSTLVSGDDKGEVIIWDRGAGKERQRLHVKGWVYGMALAPDASSLLVAERLPRVFDSGRHAGIKIWDPVKAVVRHDLTKIFKGEMLSAAAYSPDGKVLAVARGGEIDGTNGKVTLLDPSDGSKMRELTPGHLNGATDVVFHPDGKALYSAGRDTVVRAWSIPDGKLVQELGQPRGGQFKDWIHAVAVAPDGRWLAAADMMGQVQVWSLTAK
jgi:WD40 repeat protein